MVCNWISVFEPIRNMGGMMPSRSHLNHVDRLNGRGQLSNVKARGRTGEDMDQPSLSLLCGMGLLHRLGLHMDARALTKADAV
jgi:hypothetical protein